MRFAIGSISAEERKIEKCLLSQSTSFTWDSLKPCSLITWQLHVLEFVSLLLFSSSILPFLQ